MTPYDEIDVLALIIAVFSFWLSLFYLATVSVFPGRMVTKIKSAFFTLLITVVLYALVIAFKYIQSMDIGAMDFDRWFDTYIGGLTACFAGLGGLILCYRCIEQQFERITSWMCIPVIIWAACTAIGAAFCGWQLFGALLLALAPFVVKFVLVFPRHNSITGGASTRPIQALSEDGVRTERERVLTLLERGSISAEQAGILISALGKNNPGSVWESLSTKTHRLLIIGVSFIAIGFFLPWAGIDSLNGRKEMEYAVNFPHGIGWALLWLGLLAVVLPHLCNALRLNKDTAVIAMASMCAMGAMLAVWMVVEVATFMQPGLLLSLAGYGLMTATLVQENRGLRNASGGLARNSSSTNISETKTKIPESGS